MRRQSRLDRLLVGLGALVLVSAVVRFALSRGVAAPWIAPDEQLYGLLGRSLAAGDGFTILGESVPYYSLLYPALVGLPFVWSGVSTGVMLVQALQALFMSATAVPVYFWARPIAGRRWAMLAAGLTVLIPGLAYSGLLMSEVLYYPTATLAVWMLAMCLRDPTLARQGLLLAAVGLALATRLQAVGFVAVIVVAPALMAVAERSTAPFRRMLPAIAVLGLSSGAWVGGRVAFGGGDQVVGAYAPLTHASSYGVRDIAQSIAWEAGGLVLLTVGIPLVALGVLTWGALRGTEADPRVRALVATAVSYLAVTLLEVSAFASRFVEHVTERQLLSIAPPAFVAFAVWLHRGAPRPQPVTSVVAFLVAASALLLPLNRVVTPAAAADALSTIPLEQLNRVVGGSTLEATYAGAVAILILLAVFIPRRATPLLAILVALALGASSLSASREVRERSREAASIAFANASRDWIDASGARDVVLLVTGDRTWPSVWQELFWNSSISRVARLREADSLGVVAQKAVTLEPDGRLSGAAGDELTAAYVAAPVGVSVVGEQVTTLPASTNQQGMALWRVDGPVRISRRVTGLRPNGDLHGGEAGEILVYGCGPGSLELTLLGKQGLPTRILVDGSVAAEKAVPPGTVWRPSIPTTGSSDGEGVCAFQFQTDGLIGSTRVDFVPVTR